MRIGSLFALAIALVATQGCYITRQAHGQLEILVGQRAVGPIIEGDSLGPDEARKLLVVEEVREYAVRVIGLAPSDNYTTFYDTRGKPVSYAVSGCRTDCFENYIWSFPIAGSFPYKGFFSREDALAEARIIEQEGYDSTVREIAAYSTLGWFRDPVFSNMLRRSEADLVALVFHELTHGSVFAPDSTDFNEEMATFVGVRAALQFLATRYGGASRELARAQAQFHDDELFDDFMRALYARLDAIYKSDAPTAEKRLHRDEEFSGAKAEFRRLKARMRTPSYHFFERLPLNNAEIVANIRYGGYAKYDRIFRRAGESWVTFLTWMRLAAASPDPQQAVDLLADGRVPALER